MSHIQSAIDTVLAGFPRGGPGATASDAVVAFPRGGFSQVASEEFPRGGFNVIGQATDALVSVSDLVLQAITLIS